MKQINHKTQIHIIFEFYILIISHTNAKVNGYQYNQAEQLFRHRSLDYNKKKRSRTDVRLVPTNVVLSFHLCSKAIIPKV